MCFIAKMALEDKDRLQDCVETLESISDNLISNGRSKREITVVTLNKIAQEIKKLEETLT